MRRALKYIVIYASLIAAIMGWHTPSCAQEKLPPWVVIKVHDPAGAAIPGAEVTVVPLGRGEPSILRTNQNGIAYFVGDSGRLEIRAAYLGFATQTKTWDNTTRNAQTVDFELSVGSGGGPVVVGNRISPSRPIEIGHAPGMQVKLLNKSKGERVYAVVFAKDDELLSGLLEFSTRYKVADAHFTGIGAISSATAGWLDLGAKAYRSIRVDEQAEVLSLIGDVATFDGKPVVHAHIILGKQDGSTIGGHLWEAHVNPTLEVFITVNDMPLKKKADAASGMKLIDPKQ